MHIEVLVFMVLRNSRMIFFLKLYFLVSIQISKNINRSYKNFLELQHNSNLISLRRSKKDSMHF